MHSHREVCERAVRYLHTQKQSENCGRVLVYVWCVLCVNSRFRCVDFGLFVALQAVTEEEATPSHVEMSAPRRECTEPHWTIATEQCKVDTADIPSYI